MLFLTSLMFSSAYCWNTRNYRALGMPICSAIGFLLVLLAPWNRFLAGFVLYQRYSPFLSSGMRLRSLSCALSGLCSEFQYSIFFHESSGGDSVRIDQLPLRTVFALARYLQI